MNNMADGPTWFSPGWCGELIFGRGTEVDKPQFSHCGSGNFDYTLGERAGLHCHFCLQRRPQDNAFSIHQQNADNTCNIIAGVDVG